MCHTTLTATHKLHVMKVCFVPTSPYGFRRRPPTSGQTCSQTQEVTKSVRVCLGDEENWTL